MSEYRSKMNAELRHSLIELAGALVENYPARMLALDLADALRRAESLGGAGQSVVYALRDAAHLTLREFGEPSTPEPDPA